MRFDASICNDQLFIGDAMSQHATQPPDHKPSKRDLIDLMKVVAYDQGSLPEHKRGKWPEDPRDFDNYTRESEIGLFGGDAWIAYHRKKHADENWDPTPPFDWREPHLRFPEPAFQGEPPPPFTHHDIGVAHLIAFNEIYTQKLQELESASPDEQMANKAEIDRLKSLISVGEKNMEAVLSLKDFNEKSRYRGHESYDVERGDTWAQRIAMNMATRDPSIRIFDPDPADLFPDLSPPPVKDAKPKSGKSRRKGLEESELKAALPDGVSVSQSGYGKR